MSHTPIFILGMHRSGTSCLAGSLQQCGLHLGKVHETAPHNRKGNRENQQVMDLNNAVLARSGGSWEHPPADLRWNGDMAAARDAILEGLAGGSQGAPWGFKDPRTLLTLEFWRQAAPQARLVGSFRHPVRVVRSLHKRGHGMDMPTGLALWATYNERLLALHASSPFPIVSFDLPAAGYRAAIDALALQLDLPSRSPDADPFFEQQLRTHDDETDDALQASHLALYDALVHASGQWGP